MGWRLGGKCATGRNAAMRDRIEEHGIHFLLGFYENAFRIVRELYTEYLRDFPCPFQSWQDAFRKQSTTTAMVLESGTWIPFGIEWDQKKSLPGDGAIANEEAPSAWSYVRSLLSWMMGESGKMVNRLDQSAREISAAIHGVDQTLHRASDMASRFPSAPPRRSGSLRQISLLMDACTVAVRTTLHAMEQAIEGLRILQPRIRQAPSNAVLFHARQMLILFDIGAAIVRGMIADGIISDGFEKIDDQELMAWLHSHGCNHTDSAVIRSGYDACFAYENGDTKRPTMSAGVGLHGALRLWFSYKGSIFWPMRAGMAEVIFAPLYRVLNKRGVRFEFFHRVENLRLTADKTAIERIEISVQAKAKNASDYDPLIRIKGLDCWPNQPLYDQLENGGTLTNGDMESAWAAPAPVGNKTLIRGTDFTDVVLGVSLGSIPYVCRELLAGSQKWRDMVAHVPTVQTQALQLWLKVPASQLGYQSGTVSDDDNPACVSSFVEPFDTYADMSNLLGRESWQDGDRALHAAYFCNVLPEAANVPAPGTNPGFPDTQKASVKQNVMTFLNRDVRWLWPETAVGTEQFPWTMLADPREGSGAQRLDSQYWRANIDPSERYVLSPPGAIRFRLRPDASEFSNLFLAGDWTYTPLSSGCVEAAAMSGIKAAHAISGSGPKIYGWD